MIKTALYARVSSEKQEQDGTIHSQIAKLQEFAQTNGFIVTGEYFDDGFSGDLLARPGLDKLRDDAQKEIFERVLILAPDRLARKYIYCELVADELRKHGIAVQFLNQKDDGTPETKLLLGMTGLFGEYEKAKIIDRTRRGKMHKVSHGIIITSLPPYGYTYIRKTVTTPGRLAINDDQAPNVRLIFDLCVKDGLSIEKIRRKLRDLNIPPPGRYGKPEFWARSTLKRILHNQTYAGIWHFNKHSCEEPRRRSMNLKPKRMLKTSRRLRPVDQWVSVPGVPALIDRKTWEAAQSQIKRNLTFRTAKYQYLLSGLCRCGQCGKSFVGDPCHGKLYYKCSGPRYNRPAPRTCNIGMIKAERLESAIWESIKSAIQNPSLLISQLPKLEAHISKGGMSAKQESAELESELAKARTSEERLLQAFSSNVIDLDQLKAQMDKIKQKKTRLNDQLQALSSSIPPTEADIPVLEQFCRKTVKGLALLNTDFDKRRNFIRLLVDYVVINPDKITIRGAIPTSHLPDHNQHSGVLATPSTCYGQNPAFRFELTAVFR